MNTSKMTDAEVDRLNADIRRHMGQAKQSIGWLLAHGCRQELGILSAWWSRAGRAAGAGLSLDEVS